MNILKNLKSVYFGDGCLFTHLSIFSLLGIMTLALNNVLSSSLGNLMGGFLGFAPSNKYELFLNFLIGLLILIFFIGYSFNFANYCFKQNCRLPEVNLDSMSVFVKMLPLFIIWGIYITFLCMLGGVLIPYTSPFFYIFYSVIICIIPFIYIIYVIFAQDFVYHSELFNPKFLFKVLDKTFGAVIFLTVQLCLLCILPVVVVNIFFYLAKLLHSPYWQLGLRLLGVCSGVYLFFIVKLLYLSRLSNIIRNKAKDVVF